MAHTPGPWMVDERSGRLGRPAIFTSDSIPIWIADVADGVFGETSEHSSNANLIAAAPELLEALKAIYAGCVSEYRDAGQEHRVNLNVSVEAFKSLESAIDKAEGRR